MKLNLGETRLEKDVRLATFHRWFAWRPVQVGPNDWRWLEVVERSIERHRVGRRPYWVIYYRPIEDIT